MKRIIYAGLPSSTYSYLTAGDKSRLSQIRTAGLLTEDFSYDGEGKISDYTQTVDARTSVTEVVFAVTRLPGFTFVRRLKQLSKQRLYSFEKRKIYENLGYRILPKLYIGTKVTEDNWDDILRFVATIKLKRTTTSQLFKRLNSYSNQHPLYQALKNSVSSLKLCLFCVISKISNFASQSKSSSTKSNTLTALPKAVAFGSN